MLKRFPKLFPLAVVCLVVVLTAGLIPAQQQPPPAGQAAQPGADPNANGMDVQARGPVHEAYADTMAPSTETPAVTKMPPDGIDELPPDHKPDGNNVQWIPGYWHWDDDRKDFTWISGFWRSVPPGRVWVPGSWRGTQGANPPTWQWVPAFWQEAPAQQAATTQGAAVQSDVQYLPEPPKTMEIGPTTPQATATSFYTPGTWVYRDGRYLWRAGYWMEFRTGWVWVPAHFRWTPIGYVYVEGYWDYPLQTRGVMYAPIAYTNAVYLQPGYVYTPTYVVSDQCMMGAMFVRRGWGCYYFGNYYEPQYATSGYTAWCGTVGPNGAFVVGYTPGPTYAYDPLWGYYSVAYRSSPEWSVGIGALYIGRFNGTVARPEVTLVQQNVTINRVTNVNVNVVNNYTVVNRSITVNNVNVSGMAMVAPTRIVADMHPEMKIQHLPEAARHEERLQARAVREAAATRMRAENAIVARGGRIPKAGEPLHTTKVDVPKAAIARAQIDERKAPPANPHTAAHNTNATAHPTTTTPGTTTHPGTTTTTPGTTAHPGTTTPGTTVHPGTTAPGTTGTTGTPANPNAPKTDPKGPNAPKTDPKGPNAPKTDPKGPNAPKNDSKHDPGTGGKP
jgi:hypothetical protein